ncbi:MAG: cobalamin biosynthesis protein [Ferroplasma sp.]
MPCQNGAVVAITKNGCKIAEKICNKLNFKLYTGPRIDNGNGIPFVNTRSIIEKIFAENECIIFVMALGAVVRLISPYLKSKITDPAVVTIDDAGNFAIPVVSGHHGANELAMEASKIIGSVPVITTASDVNNIISPEIMAREYGMAIKNIENLTKISADIVNGKCVNWINETGIHINLPVCNNPESTVYITYRADRANNSLLLVPRVLSIGIGFSTDAGFNDMKNAISITFRKYNYFIEAIKSISTIDLKSNNKYLEKIGELFACTLNFYPPSLLNAYATSRSEEVYRYTGAYSVSNAAARISSCNGKELVAKEIVNNVTVSVFLNA